MIQNSRLHCSQGLFFNCIYQIHTFNLDNNNRTIFTFKLIARSVIVFFCEDFLIWIHILFISILHFSFQFCISISWVLSCFTSGSTPIHPCRQVAACQGIRSSTLLFHTTAPHYCSTLLLHTTVPHHCSTLLPSATQFHTTLQQTLLHTDWCSQCAHNQQTCSAQCTPVNTLLQNRMCP